jgi:NADH-quinone oxidoreductase subunit J
MPRQIHMLESIVFYTLAALIIGFGVLVVTTRNTVHCVLFLVANFLCVAMVYVLLAAEFLAIIQILVYAGGIVVLYLFVVMLVNLQQQPPDASPRRRRQAGAGFALAAAMLAEISAILVFSAARPASAAANAAAPAQPAMGNTLAVGLLLYSDYLVPFEVASMLLLVAMVGAIILARKEA